MHGVIINLLSKSPVGNTARFLWLSLLLLLCPFYSAASVLEERILQASASDPAKIFEELQKISPESYAKISADALVKASYITAINVDLGLTISITKILLEKAEVLNDLNLKGSAYFNRSVAYAGAGNYDLALDAMLLALYSFENTENEAEIARIKGGLALMYVEIEEYELAIPYFEEALNSHRLREDIVNIAKVLHNRGFMKILLKDYAGAKVDLLGALDLTVTHEFKSNLPYLYKNLGKVESENGNSDIALSYFGKALKASESLNLLHYESVIRKEIAYLQMKNGLLEQARESLKLSLQVAEKFNLLKEQRNAYLLLTDLELASNNYKAAYFAKQKADELFAKMGNSRVATNLSRLDRYTAGLKEQNKRLVIEKEKEIAILAVKSEQLLKNFFIIIAIVAIILTIYFLRRFTHSKKQADIYEKQSKIDSLTGVWNRRAGESHLVRLCQREAGGITDVFSIAMLDIDLFKRVNDEFGHDVGDRVIVAICEKIQLGLRPTDMLCRWGGEEFILIFEHFDINKALDVCERIRKSIEDTEIEDVGRLTVSIGVAMFENDDVFELVKRGDVALYDAKHQGRNKVVVKNKT